MSANQHTPMVVSAARALCRRDSELCNVDFDDNWKLYSDGFLLDAQVALESVGAPELLEALKRLTSFVVTDTVESCNGNKCREAWCAGCFGEEVAERTVREARDALAAGRAAIEKATGGAA